jgi:hypothetical protein
MYLLFAISILCFLALIIAVASVARHVRSNRKSAHGQTDFAHHLFSAANDLNSRQPRTLEPQALHDVIATKSWNHSPAQANAHTSSRSFKPF